MTVTKTNVEPIYNRIGRFIQNEREKRGLSQTALGSRLEQSLTRAAIANIENGKQRILVHTLVSISRVLQIPLSELVPLEESIDSTAPVTDEVKDDLLRQLSKAVAKKVLARLIKDPNHEPTIRTKIRRKANRKSIHREPPNRPKGNGD